MAQPFLDADALAELPERGTLHPSKIRFSQDSIASYFKDVRLGSVNDLARRLTNNEVQPADIEPIRIVLKHGKTFTLDNRRLKAIQVAGIDIPYIKLNQIPPSQRYKFTTRNEGVSVVLRDQ